VFKQTPEQVHMGKVAALGCMAGMCGLPAQVHHISNGTTAKKSSDFETIGLCEGHHLGTDCSIHMTPKKFIARYGTEKELLRKVEFKLKRRINNYETI